MSKWKANDGREFPIEKWTVYKCAVWMSAAPIHEGSPYASFGSATKAFDSHAEALAYALEKSRQ